MMFEFWWCEKIIGEVVHGMDGSLWLVLKWELKLDLSVQQNPKWRILQVMLNMITIQLLSNWGGEMCWNTQIHPGFSRCFLEKPTNHSVFPPQCPKVSQAAALPVTMTFETLGSRDFCTSCQELGRPCRLGWTMGALVALEHIKACVHLVGLQLTARNTMRVGCPDNEVTVPLHFISAGN